MHVVHRALCRVDAEQMMAATVHSSGVRIYRSNPAVGELMSLDQGQGLPLQLHRQPQVTRVLDPLGLSALILKASEVNIVCSGASIAGPAGPLGCSRPQHAQGPMLHTLDFSYAYGTTTIDL